MAEDLGEEHFSDALLDVLAALRDKRLGPLANYLKSGGLPESSLDTVAIPTWLAVEIAEMIEDKRLSVSGRKWTAEVRQRTHDALVGRFMEREMARMGPGSYEAAVVLASERFDRKKTAIADALKRFRSSKDEA